MAPICSYYNCSNVCGQQPLFRFPTSDPKRLQVWLNNCANPSLRNLKPSMLRNKRVCIVHFDKKFIRNENGKRYRISRLAIPESYDEYLKRTLHTPIVSTVQAQVSPENKGMPRVRVYPGPRNKDAKREQKECSQTDTKIDPLCWIQNNMETVKTECIDPLMIPTQDQNTSHNGLDKSNRGEVEEVSNQQSTPQKRFKQNFDSPQCKKLKLTLRNSNEIIRRLRSKNARLIKRINNKQLIDLNKVAFKSDFAKVLTMMQIKNKRHLWTEAEKKVSLFLYNKSPACYKYLLKNGVVLPSKSAIHNWLQSNRLPI
ncbi:uncharacterized protein LOC128673820 [Plodia interpunctella]|uniref:uncharacterized protein LOC128673820 n=1 Tax=Plodia interpunctella TaxID=58824 RepID=UPI0023678AC4|nr:uncharacterized protein LOC128673820 [Plodia interpunctella]